MVALTLLILKIFVCSEMPKNIARSVPGGHGGRGGGSARSKKSINSKTSSYLCGGRVSGHGFVIRGVSSGLPAGRAGPGLVIPVVCYVKLLRNFYHRVLISLLLTFGFKRC